MLKTENRKQKTVKMLVNCPFCGKDTMIEAPVDQADNFRNGTLVQDAFPCMPAEKREVLVSGICEDCQKSVFRE